MVDHLPHTVHKMLYSHPSVVQVEASERLHQAALELLPVLAKELHQNQTRN